MSDRDDKLKTVELICTGCDSIELMVGHLTPAAVANLYGVS